MTGGKSPEPNVYPAVIEAGSVYTAEEFTRRVRWRKHSWRQAKKQGLPTVRFGSRDYVIGDQALEWFKTLGQQSGQLSVSCVEPVPALTWLEIIAIEPHLATIIAEAEAIQSASWLDCSLLKAAMSKRVGCGARDPRLATSEIYVVAIGKLVEALRL